MKKTKQGQTKIDLISFQKNKPYKIYADLRNCLTLKEFIRREIKSIYYYIKSNAILIVLVKLCQDLIWFFNLICPWGILFYKKSFHSNVRATWFESSLLLRLIKLLITILLITHLNYFLNYLYLNNIRIVYV